LNLYKEKFIYEEKRPHSEKKLLNPDSPIKEIDEYAQKPVLTKKVTAITKRYKLTFNQIMLDI